MLNIGSLNVTQTAMASLRKVYTNWVCAGAIPCCNAAGVN
jgi:hypothetical protein